MNEHLPNETLPNNHTKVVAQRQRDSSFGASNEMLQKLEEMRKKIGDDSESESDTDTDEEDWE